MSYNEYRYPDGMRGASVDNTGHTELPNYGSFAIRKNSMHLASSKEDFTVNDTKAGRKTALEALERGLLVFDQHGNAMSAEQLTEAE